MSKKNINAALEELASLNNMNTYDVDDEFNDFIDRDDSGKSSVVEIASQHSEVHSNNSDEKSTKRSDKEAAEALSDGDDDRLSLPTEIAIESQDSAAESLDRERLSDDSINNRKRQANLEDTYQRSAAFIEGLASVMNTTVPALENDGQSKLSDEESSDSDNVVKKKMMDPHDNHSKLTITDDDSNQLLTEHVQLDSKNSSENQLGKSQNTEEKAKAKVKVEQDLDNKIDKRLLTSQYARKVISAFFLHKSLKLPLCSVNAEDHCLDIKLRNNVTVKDYFKSFDVECDDPASAAKAAVITAKMKGWKSIKISGEPDYVEALVERCKEVGLGYRMDRDYSNIAVLHNEVMQKSQSKASAFESEAITTQNSTGKSSTGKSSIGPDANTAPEKEPESKSAQAIREAEEFERNALPEIRSYM
jgi:hypothetical protein